MVKKIKKISFLLFAIFFINLLFNCRSLCSKSPTKLLNKEIAVDQKPTLIVSVIPEEPTKYDQVVFFISATDDIDLSEKSFYFPTLNKGVTITPSKTGPMKELNEIDSLIPHLLSERDIKKLGDSLIVKISVYDFPKKQETSILKIIKIKEKKK